MSDDVQPVQGILDALNAERYGPSLWWRHDNPQRPLTPTNAPEWDDSETTTARRRRTLAAAYDEATRKAAT